MFIMLRMLGSGSAQVVSDRSVFGPNLESAGARHSTMAGIASPASRV
jgi:hypothetical protein